MKSCRESAAIHGLQVVTKVFDGVNSVAAHAALEQQVQVLRDCQHVCRILGVSSVEQKACIVMERHQSLAKVLTGCPGKHALSQHASLVGLNPL